MSKETEKMNSIRITRRAVKTLLTINSGLSLECRKIIKEYWDKEDNAECRKALNKAHKELSKRRAIVRECQKQLKDIKFTLRKLNHQHDIHVKAEELAKRAIMAE